jgi:aryl-alcohol dehydrogenase
VIDTEAWLVSESDADFQLARVTLDHLRSDEVLVELTASGICHMDIEAKQLVPLPAVLGHEGVGVIKEVGRDVGILKVGDRVIMTYAACGHCHKCTSDQPYHCVDTWDITFSGRREDGTPTAFVDGEPISAAFFQQSSFGRLAITPARGLVKVDDSEAMDDVTLAALPCGILTGAGIVACQFGFSGGESIAIFGAGAVGLSAVMAAKKLGADSIVAIDVKEERLALARQLGATDVFNPTDPNNDLTKFQVAYASGFDFVIDTTGNSRAFVSCIEALATAGRMAVCILPAPMEDFVFKPFEWWTKAAKLEAVSFGEADAKTFLPKLIEWHQAGEFPVELLMKVYPYEELNAAISDSLNGDTIKAVLDFRS